MGGGDGGGRKGCVCLSFPTFIVGIVIIVSGLVSGTVCGWLDAGAALCPVDHHLPPVPCPHPRGPHGGPRHALRHAALQRGRRRQRLREGQGWGWEERMGMKGEAGAASVEAVVGWNP